MTFALYVFITALLDVTGVLCARFFWEKQKNHFLFLSLLAFGLSGYTYIKMLSFTLTAIVNVIYLSISSTLIVLFCYIFFKERVHWLQGIGVFLIITGVSLL